MADPRTQIIDKFLTRTGWAEATRTPVTGDASTRSYQRLKLADSNAILMDAPPAREAPACPPGASGEERARLGFNALARLAGPNLNAFTALAGSLRAAGLAAPEIYAADPAHGLAVMEDLGPLSLAAAVHQGAEEEVLYRAAVEALATVQVAATPPPPSEAYVLLGYDALALQTEADLFIDWYWPYLRRGDLAAEVRTQWHAAWWSCFVHLSQPSVIALRDYHAQNLIWRPQAQGLARLGLIDFQDALLGQPAYDLASLLEDARRDVPQALAAAMIAHYKDHMRGSDRGFDSEQFDHDYAILAAQRNAKILGIFARLVARDSKPAYETLMPRVRAYFAADLARPAVAQVRAWFETHLPEMLS